MIRAIPFLAAAALALALGLGPVRAQEAQPASPAPDTVVATVNGEPVHYAEVEMIYDELPEQYRQLPIAMLYDQLVELLIDRKLMAKAARSEGMGEDPGVQRAIAFAGDGALENAYISKLLRERLTDENLRAAYDKMVVAFVPEDEVRARHILVKTEEEARQIIAELESGADFTKLAQEKSLDPSAKTNAGELDWFTHDGMVPEFADAAFALKEGELAKDPVKSSVGWHVIEAEGRRKSEPPSYEASLNKLRAQEAQAAINEASAALREGVTIERFTPDGKPLPEPAG